MMRTIVIWGVILGGGVFLLQPVQASSLEWREYDQRMQIEARSDWLLSGGGSRNFRDLLLGSSAPPPGVIPKGQFQPETVIHAESEVPVLALPESGTLLLLGLGLAGIASLMRKK